MANELVSMRLAGSRILLGPAPDALAKLDLKGRILVLGSARSAAALDWSRVMGSVEIFAKSAPHNPEAIVAQARALAQGFRPQTIVAIGSSSAIDLGKAVASVHEATLLAIPSTLGGAEMTRSYGSLEAGGHKGGGAIRRGYGAVIYDPALLSTLPDSYLGATGMNAFSHTIEALYSRRTHWPAAAAAERAGRRLPTLLTSASRKRDEVIHTQLFEAACLAGLSIDGLGMGVHHAICHALGGLTGIAHGTLNAIVLVPALHGNSEACPEAVAAVAKDLGLADLARTAREIVAAFDLPVSLAGLGVSRDVIEPAAEHVLASANLKNNPALLDRQAIVRIIKEAYGGPQ